MQKPELITFTAKHGEIFLINLSMITYLCESSGNHYLHIGPKEIQIDKDTFKKFNQLYSCLLL